MAKFTAKLHGRPLVAAKQLARLADNLWKGFPSRRAWGREVAPLVHELATTNVEPGHFANLLPDWLVRAIVRERHNIYLDACGVGVRARVA